MSPDHPVVARVVAELAKLSARDTDFDQAGKLFDDARRIEYRHAHRILDGHRVVHRPGLTS
jgi:hypothetical protein